MSLTKICALTPDWMLTEAFSEPPLTSILLAPRTVVTLPWKTTSRASLDGVPISPTSLICIEFARPASTTVGNSTR